MKTHTHTLKAAEGLHARPAGRLVKLAGGCKSRVLLQKGDKQADARRIMALMGLCARRGEEITFLVEGPDEDAVCEEIARICRESL